MLELLLHNTLLVPYWLFYVVVQRSRFSSKSPSWLFWSDGSWYLMTSAPFAWKFPNKKLTGSLSSAPKPQPNFANLMQLASRFNDNFFQILMLCLTDSAATIPGVKSDLAQTSIFQHIPTRSFHAPQDKQYQFWAQRPLTDDLFAIVSQVFTRICFLGGKNPNKELQNDMLV